MQIAVFDKHSHYTGSLPLEYIWSNLKSRQIESSQIKQLWNLLIPSTPYDHWLRLESREKDFYFPQFKSALSSVFGKKWEDNWSTFYILYEGFQSITKSADREESCSLYKRGAYAIAQSFFKEGVNFFEIKAGPDTDFTKTKERLEAMDSGFRQFEKEQGVSGFAAITLTYIQKKDGFINFSSETFNKILSLMDSPLGERINGFDFSGDELSPQSHLTIEIIKEIGKYNHFCREKGKRECVVTVHAGEDFRLDIDFHLSFLEQLINSGISRVGHGTVLWIPESLFEFSVSQNQTRLSLLRSFARKGVEFEICPTSNALLTPLADAKNVPLNKFKEVGLRYSLNTDNKTIFSTTTKREVLKTGY